jgi:YVTN family beta-propeller protein
MKSFARSCRLWIMFVAIVHGFACSASAEILATLESPPNNQKVSGLGAVAGWVFSTDPQVTITRVQLRVDEKPFGDIPFPGERSDVAQAYSTIPQALNSGFAYGANFSGLTGGSHKIGVEITDSRGGSKIIDHDVTVIRVGGFPFLSFLDLSGANPKIDGKQIRLPFTEATEKPADTTTEAKVQQVNIQLAWQPDRQTLGIVGSDNTNDPTRPTNSPRSASAIVAPRRDSRAADGDGSTIRYTLENPSPFATTVSGKGLISGWAFSTTADTKVEKIELKVDGESVLTIPCCTPRVDVAQDPGFKDFPQAERSGFSTEVNFNNLSSDKTHDLEIVIQTGNDKVSIPLTVTSVRLGSLDFIDDIDLTDAEVSISGGSLHIEKFHVIGKDSTGTTVRREVTADFTWEESCQCFVTESSCGNGNIEPGEECDAEVLGGESCTSLGFSGGTLSCSKVCTFLTTECTGGQTLYVTNVRSNSVSVINTATNLVTKTIPVGRSPRGIAISPNGATAYVTNAADDSLSVINIADNTVSETVPVGKLPQSVAVTPDNASIYVVNGKGNSVTVLDAATKQARTNVNVGNEPQLIALSLDGSLAYVTNYGDNSVSVIDTRSNTVVKTITTNIGKGPNGVAVSPDGKQVYVLNFDSDSLSIVDAATNNVEAEPLKIGIQPSQVAFSPDGTRAYISSVLDFSVIVFDPAAKTSLTAIAIFESSNRAEPDGLVVLPKGKRLYVAGFGRNGDGDSINVVSTISDGLLGLIKVGKGPFAIALTPPK